MELPTRFKHATPVRCSSNDHRVTYHTAVDADESLVACIGHMEIALTVEGHAVRLFKPAGFVPRSSDAEQELVFGSIGLDFVVQAANASAT